MAKAPDPPEGRPSEPARGVVSRADFEELLREAQEVEHQRSQLEEELQAGVLRIARMEARMESLERENARERKVAADLAEELEGLRGESARAREEVARKEGELVAVGEAMAMAKLSGVEEGRRAQLTEGGLVASEALTVVQEQVRSLSHRVEGVGSLRRPRWQTTLAGVVIAGAVGGFGWWKASELRASEGEWYAGREESLKTELLRIRGELTRVQEDLSDSHRTAGGLRQAMAQLAIDHRSEMQAALESQHAYSRSALESVERTLETALDDFEGRQGETREELLAVRESGRSSQGDADRLRLEIDEQRRAHEQRLLELSGALEAALAKQGSLLVREESLLGEIRAFDERLRRAGLRIEQLEEEAARAEETPAEETAAPGDGDPPVGEPEGSGGDPEDPPEGEAGAPVPTEGGEASRAGA